ncbi:MAG: hypothetical protein IT353_11310 [Gemmatimonadaceae bacterium]|nr:hypothetical protein [Gemmatimonadaceae bacterium]
MRPIEILAIDFLSTLKILRSVAVAKEIASSTTYGWRTTDLIASANLWGEVGMWEAQVPNGRQLKAAIQASTRDRALHMIRIAGEGPLPLVKWLAGQIAIRDRCLQNYHDEVAAFRQINQATLSALDASVKLAKGARFVASAGLITGTVAVALYGMGITVGGTMIAGTYTTGSLVALPVIGLTKSVSFAVIKDWNNSQHAKAVSVTFEVSKAATNEGSGRMGGQMAAGKGIIIAAAAAGEGDILIAQEAQKEALKLSERKLAEAQGKLWRMQRMQIGGQSVKGAKKQAVRVATQKATIEAERQAVARTTAALGDSTEELARRAARAQWLRVWGRRVVGGSTAAFALWDSYDAIAELGE